MAQKITAPRGTQDIMPGESYKWILLEETLRDVVARYGFKEIRVPTFEHTELFLRGVGDTTDIVGKEMYTFEDKGKRSITLRPEVTASAVRAVLEHGALNDALPLKAYYIANCFRYEKPQAGRLREFHQLGIEVYGSGDYTADAEVIAVGDMVLKELGIKNVKLFINSIGCPSCRPDYQKKLVEYFDNHKEELCPTCIERKGKNPLRILDCKEAKCSQIAKGAPVGIDHLCDECRDHFEGVKATLNLLQIEYAINTRIVRGLDYYTKTVFEFIYSGIGAQDTVCGGGRYDGLIEQLGGKPTPGVGFGMGLERLLLTIEAENADIGSDIVPDVFFVYVDEKQKAEAFHMAQKARIDGLNAQSDIMGRSFNSQMKYANKIGSRYCVVLGEDEISSNKAIAKNMQTKDQIEIDLIKPLLLQIEI